MALESGTYVKDLVSTNPPGTDAISQGDDHLRLIKSVLQNSFPSNSNAPIIPDVSGNGGKYLQVNSGATATEWATIRNRGYINRSQFDYSNTTTILIGAGSYEVDNGSAPETFYWDSQLTFVLGSGGSNASSSAIGTSQWQYIYMDESAISASPLVAASFLNSTTAPTYSHTKHGWYNSSDRCVFAVYINASGDIDPFYHNGSDFVQFAQDYPEFDVNPPTFNSWTTLGPFVRTLPIGKETELTWTLKSTGGSTNSVSWKWRPFGSALNGHVLGITEAGTGGADDEHISANIRTYLGTDNKLDYYANSSVTGHRFTVYSNGFYIPGGM